MKRRVRGIGLVVLVMFLGGFDFISYDHTLHLLIVGDPFSFAMSHIAQDFAAATGYGITAEIVSYNDMRTLTLQNSYDFVSNYDIVSFDVVWTSEYGDNDVLLPLDDFLAETPDLDTDDFLHVAYSSSAYNGQQLGLPIQPHPELLWYRTDLIDIPPETTDDVLRIAAEHTAPDNDAYGICWNAQRGQALGQTMAHFYAAFGQPILIEGQPQLDTAEGLAAAEYALALLDYSPPDILNMAWDQRTLRFSMNGCAMTYGWAARAYLVESTPTSQVAGLVGYAPAPHAPTAAPITPLGTWSLGIPSNIDPERLPMAWQGLAWLSSVEGQTLLAEHGNGGMPRASLLENSALVERYPAFPVVLDLNATNQLNDWMRPAVPEWASLADILGTTFHDMLRGDLTPQQAVAMAQQQAVELMER